MTIASPRVPPEEALHPPKNTAASTPSDWLYSRILSFDRPIMSCPAIAPYFSAIKSPHKREAWRWFGRTLRSARSAIRPTNPPVTYCALAALSYVRMPIFGNFCTSGIMGLRDYDLVRNALYCDAFLMLDTCLRRRETFLGPFLEPKTRPRKYFRLRQNHTSRIGGCATIGHR